MNVAQSDRFTTDTPLRFLWLELTNRCNLQCLHCYADSGPRAEVAHPLTRREREGLIREAAEVGCRRIQFIGGEPTLSRDLQALIDLAKNTGYELIEVYSNLTHLPEDLLRCFTRFDVCVATSIYAPSAAVHDAITKVNGSFRRTVRNVRRLAAAGIRVRASIVEMGENAGLTERTVNFLRNELRIETIKIDRLRRFGRGGDHDADVHELCGACANGTLCVSADGKVSPCIMSKQWGVGSVRETSLTEIVCSARLGSVRADLSRAASEQRAASLDGCGPDECTPIIGCPPYNQPGVRFDQRSERKGA